MVLVLLESTGYSDKEGRTFYITNPETILQCYKLSEVGPLLDQVENAVAKGFFAAGFLSYEAGFALLPQMPSHSENDFPLAWFALTKAPQHGLSIDNIPEFNISTEVAIRDLTLSMSPEEYTAHIRSIKREIEDGYTYQVNFTMRYRGRLLGSPRTLYRRLRQMQSVSYAAFIETDDWAVLSLSPELFFHKSDRDIWMRPMKGTAARGRTLDEDVIQANQLRESEKERSENLMIVDMLRSDLGKICETGTVAVTDPLRVERYETLLQMTSEIHGRLRKEIGLADIMRAAFPSGSVTGAPKVRTMQIIRDHETAPRKIYTGSIGFLFGSEAVFNVAIRTALCDLKTDALEMGVGSGILYEADAEKEYQECELKARFLKEQPLEFQLVETILWDHAGGYQLLDFHLDRLMQSAEYFLFSVSREAVQNFLSSEERKLREQPSKQRVRLVVDAKGTPHMESSVLEALRGTQRIRFADTRTDSSDVFLFHKTTRRPVYSRAFELAREQGYFDVLFCSERDEVTEGAISNVFSVKNGMYFTPPVSCGLLAGTFRRHLLETKPFPIEERILHKTDIEQAEAIYLTNAVRGLVRCFLER